MAKPSYLPESVTTYWDPDEGRVVQPAGTVIQIQHAYKKDVQTITGDWMFFKITGLDVTITPKSSSSHFLLEAHIVQSNAYFSSGFRFHKDDLIITSLLGDAANFRTRVSFGHTQYDGNSGNEDYNVYMSTGKMMHEESGTAGTPITYSIFASGYNSAYPLTINQSYENSDAASRIRAISSFTVTEIEA